MFLDELWRIFCRFAASKLPLDNFYSFVQQCWFDFKDNPSIFNCSASKQPEADKKQSGTFSKRETSPIQSPLLKLKKEEVKTPTTSETTSNTLLRSDSDDIIPGTPPEVIHKTPLKNKEKLKFPSTSKSNQIATSSQSTSNGASKESPHPKIFSRVSTNKYKEKSTFNKELFEKNHNELLNIFSTIDGPPIGSKPKQEDGDTLLSASDKWLKNEKVAKKEDVVIDIEENSMDVDNDSHPPEPAPNKSKIKITDYFTKLGKS